MKPERISEIDGQPLEPWRQHLLDAGAYMETNGHCKGILWNGSGAVCFHGAIIRVAGYANAKEGLRRLSAYLGGTDYDAIKFNNAPETTKEMAVNALIGAALSK